MTQTAGDMVDSLLATGGMPKPVKEVLEHAAHVVAKKEGWGTIVEAS